LPFLQTVSEPSFRLMAGRAGNTAIGAQTCVEEKFAPEFCRFWVIGNSIAAVRRKIGE
jgi:hypothetical protein